MERKEYISSLNNFLEIQKRDIEKLAGFSAPDFRILNLNCSEIESKQTQWINSLEDNGVTKKTPVLYYFKIVGGSTPDKIQKIIGDSKKKYKSKSSKYQALPKVNFSENLSYVLYVGKTNSNFISRLQNHLGLVSAKTYSLQLMSWACQLNLELELHYAIMDIAKEEIRYLEQLESVLHFHLKPILGRSAH